MIGLMEVEQPVALLEGPSFKLDFGIAPAAGEGVLLVGVLAGVDVSTVFRKILVVVCTP